MIAELEAPDTVKKFFKQRKQKENPKQKKSLNIRSGGVKRKRSQVSSEEEEVVPVKKTFVPKIIQ